MNVGDMKMFIDRNEKLVHSLWDVHHKMRRLHDGKSSQSRILIVLREHEGMTQKELTDHLHVQPGSASEILSKMEQSGLITRTPNQSDQRTMDIFLTEKGISLSSEAMKQRKILYDKMFVCLTPEEQDALFSILEKLLADWDTRFEISGERHRHNKSEE